MLIFDPSVNGPGTPFSVIEAGSLPNGLFGWGVFNITNTPVAPVSNNGVLQSPARYVTEVSQASYTENSDNPANDPRVWVPPAGPSPNLQYTGTEVSNALQVMAFNTTPWFSTPLIGGVFNSNSPLGIYSKPGLFILNGSQSFLVSSNYGRDWYTQGVFPTYSSAVGWDGNSVYLALLTKQNLVILQSTPFSLGWDVVEQIPLSGLISPSSYYTLRFVYPVGGGAVLVIQGYNTSYATSSLYFYYLNGTSSPVVYNTSEIASLNPVNFNIGFFGFKTGAAIYFYSTASSTVEKAYLFGAGGLVDITSITPPTPWVSQGMTPLDTGYQLPTSVNTGAQLYPTANLLSLTATSPI